MNEVDSDSSRDNNICKKLILKLISMQFNGFWGVYKIEYEKESDLSIVLYHMSLSSDKATPVEIFYDYTVSFFFYIFIS